MTLTEFKKKAEQAGMSKHTLLEETEARGDMVIVGSTFIDRLYALVAPEFASKEPKE